MFESIRFMGSGLGYRKELFEGSVCLKDKVDCVEIVSEHYLKETDRNEKALEMLTDNYNVLLHGLGLSLGSPIIDKVYLMNIKRLVLQTKVPYYTDHLSITRSAGFTYGHLSPILYTRSSLESCIENVNRIQDVLGIPLALENITYGFDITDSQISHGDFLSELVERTGCGLLLDLTNVFINSHNHSFNPEDYLDAFPLSHVIHIHTSGGHRDNNGGYIDSHSYSVPQEVWSLLEYVLPKTSVKSVILERDGRYDESGDSVIEDVAISRSYLDKLKVPA